MVPLMRLFAAEESGSYLRHGLRNKLAAIRNAAFYLRKKVTNPDARVAQMIELIDSELAAAEAMMHTKLPPADPKARCELGTLCEGAAALVRGDRAELELALWCLREKSPGRHPRVTQTSDGRWAIEVPAGADEMGVAIAKRIAARHGGSLELAADRTTLILVEAARA
jgi:signal transduction histidine kinase